MTTQGNPLHIAARRGDLDTVRQLIAKGTDFNVRDHDGIAPLHIAAERGYFAIVDYLVGKGATINIEDKKGIAPLHIAAERGYFAIVDYLVGKGATINIEDKKGQTPLHMAAKNGRFEKVLGYLIGKGAGINIKDNEGRTPLHIAVEELRVKTAEFLVDEGANINSKDNDGMTSLHVAAKKGECIEIVIKLIHKGADINIRDKNGQTPLHTAAKVNNEYTMRELVKLGAEMNIKDNDGRTPLDVAGVTEEQLTEPQEVHGISNSQITEEESEEEKHLAALEQTLKEKGKINKTIMQCAFIGTPRSGKSSLMKRLIGERPTPSSPSTGVADKVVQVIVRSSTTAANVSDLAWEKLTYDDEAIVVVLNTSQSHRDNVASSKAKSHSSEGVPHTEFSAVKQDTSELESKKQPKHQAELSKSNPTSTDVTDPKLAVDFCRSALHRNFHNAKRILEKGGWLLYLTDTGGQIEFQELLPLLVSGPTVFFLVFRLDHDLNKQFTVEYVRSTGTKSKPYLSTFTVKEALLQSLASIASMVTYVNREGKEVPLKPQVFIVGTHRDMVSEAEVDRINHALQKLVATTGVYHEGIIQFGSESRMLLVVNNLADDDSDIQLVRNAIQRLKNRGDFNVIAPPSWLIFSLIIRQHEDCVLSYEKCFEIARKCGITDEEELNNALLFLHKKVGLIRHFQLEGLKDLHKIVIQDPQVLFERITDLVMETFTFDKTDPAFWEEFRKKGIFPFSTFKRISGSSDDLLTPELLVKLLQHLHIIALLQEQRRYFMPCILAHAKPAQTTQRICEQSQNNPSLLVSFRCGFCPKGLFAALVVYLLAQTKGDFQWRLQTQRIFRDQISFSVGSYDTVSIAVQPKFFQITCDTSASSELSHNRQFPLAKTCEIVRHCIETGIQEMNLALHYDATYYLAFYCPGVHQGTDTREPHPAEIRFHANKPCTLRCELAEGKAFKLPPGYEQWFTEVSGSQQFTEETGSSGSDTLPEQMKLKIKSLEADNEKLRRQLDQDKSNSSYNSFPGVEVVGEEELVVTNEAMNFQWKHHGFRLHVPENSLSEGISKYSVNIKASLAGRFELPDGYELVSAVYWVKTSEKDKFTKPITIEVQHCANFSNPNQLHFVRTSRALQSLSYKFKVIDGGTFTLGNKYGALSTTHFSGIGVAKKVEPDEQSCKYCAQVYFTVKNLKDYLYYCHFVVTKDLEMCLAVAKRKYQQEYDIAPPVTFVGDQVALDIPDDGTKTDNGWEIVPVHKTHIKKDRVDNFSSEKTWVPECVLLLEWKQKDAAPETLKHKVKLKGTGEENDFFRIVYNPGAAASSERGRLHPQPPSTPASTTIDILGDRPNLLKLLRFPSKKGNINIPEEISTKYLEFGILLLNDETGAKVSAIVSKHHEDAKQINLEILKLWVEGKGNLVSWDMLIDVLKAVGLVALASDIKEGLQH